MVTPLKTFLAELRYWKHSRFIFDIKRCHLLWKKLNKMSFSKFSSHFWQHFFRNLNFTKKLLYNPPFSWLPLVFYMKKRIYMKVRHSQLHCTQNGKPLNMHCLDSSQHGSFRVKDRKSYQIFVQNSCDEKWIELWRLGFQVIQLT